MKLDSIFNRINKILSWKNLNKKYNHGKMTIAADRMNWKWEIGLDNLLQNLTSGSQFILLRIRKKVFCALAVLAVMFNILCDEWTNAFNYKLLLRFLLTQPDMWNSYLCILVSSKIVQMHTYMHEHHTRALHYIYSKREASKKLALFLISLLHYAA